LISVLEARVSALLCATYIVFWIPEIKKLVTPIFENRPNGVLQAAKPLASPQEVHVTVLSAVVVPAVAEKLGAEPFPAVPAVVHTCMDALTES
jgi:hypothetical protein